MITVKQVCKYCGKAERYTTGEYIIRAVAMLILTGLSVAGILGICYVVKMGGLQAVGNIEASRALTAYAYEWDSEMRNITVNMVDRSCDANSYCWAREIFYKTSRLPYIYDSKFKEGRYSPVDVYKQGGDCKGLSNMVVAMMHSVGFDAHTECDTTHCVAVIPKCNYGNCSEDFAVVDLTIPMMAEMPGNKSVWEYNYISW